MAIRGPITDSFSRVHNYLRISLTERCNLRCLYCMPEQGVDLTPNERLLTTPELLRLVGVFASMGVSKVRLTGGEPLLRKDIEQVCEGIRRFDTIRTLGITTNGILLPRKLEALHAAGVNALNISLDTLAEDKFAFITRRNGLAKVLDSIRLAEHFGYSPVKINCVVMRGVNDDEIPKFVALTKERPLEVRFIEFMPFDDNKWSREKMVSFMEMMDIAEAGFAADQSNSAATNSGTLISDAPLEPAPPARIRLSDPSRGPHATGLSADSNSKRAVQSRYLGARHLQPIPGGETASLFRFPGYRGQLGFITSMTSHFCGSCNRLRLTADGNLKVCLFGEDETSLLKLLRGGASDDEIAASIRAAVAGKHFSHGGRATPEAIAAGHNRPMIHIGG